MKSTEAFVEKAGRATLYSSDGKTKRVEVFTLRYIYSIGFVLVCDPILCRNKRFLKCEPSGISKHYRAGTMVDSCARFYIV